MSRNLAIIGASYLQLPLIQKAKELQYTTHVFAWQANDVGEEAADYFYPISIIEREQILEQCRKINICGICSIASDVAVMTVNYVAEKLGLPGNSLNSAYKSTNKYQMRKTFAANQVPSPRSILVDMSTDLNMLELSYPLIVKPTDRSGSRGVFKLDSKANLTEAVNAAIKESFEKKAVIEEFAEGQEYSVEYISYHGRHYFLAMTKKYTTGAPHFIETGHLEPAPVGDDVIYNVKRVVEHALDALEIEEGASHTEIKIASDSTIKVIETGARMGGDCIGSDLVRYSTGFDFVKMVIQVACGEKPDFTKVCVPMAVESVFIFNQRDIEIFEDLKKNEPEKILQIVNYHPENIGHVTDSSNRAGCYIRKAR